MAKNEQIALRVSAEVRSRLEQEASRDGRTLSNLVTLVLTEWLAAKAEKVKPTRRRTDEFQAIKNTKQRK